MYQHNLPQYKSQKIVGAAKIIDIEKDIDKANDENRETDGSAVLVCENPLPPHDAINIRVTHEYVNKHNPQVGGYFVEYEDGYASWSPAEAFENGYTRIN